MRARAGRIRHIATRNGGVRARAKVIDAVKPGIRIVFHVCGAQPAAVFDGVLAKRHKGDVLKFVALLRVIADSAAAPADDEGALNLNRGGHAQRILADSLMNKLKARFVDGSGTDNLSVADLRAVFGAEGVVTDGREAEGSNPIAILVIAPILVAGRQRVVLGDLIVEPLAQVGAGARIRNRVRKLHKLQGAWIHERSVDDGKFVEIAALDVEED